MRDGTPPRTLLIRAGRIFDGTGGDVIEDGWIHIEDGRVLGVASSEPQVSVGARIDASGSTVLPGLIDCHVHLCLDGGDPERVVAEPYAATVIRAAAQARATLMCGVTTIRTVGGRDGVEIALRDAQREGRITGPRVFSANRFICMTGGHGSGLFGVECDGPDEMRKAVRGQLKAGADCIKLTATGGMLTAGNQPGAPQLSLEEMAAGVDEAHKAGRHVAAHVLGREGLKAALQAGVDSIEHGVGLDVDLARVMREEMVCLVPTLSCALDVPLSEYPEWARPGAAAVNELHARSFGIAVQEDVPMAMGTDCGVPGMPHGVNARELAAMVAQGVDTLSVLKAATSGGARLLGVEDQLGTLEAGRLADVLICPGDVTKDVGLIYSRREEVTVIQDGRVVRDGEALRR